MAINKTKVSQLDSKVTLADGDKFMIASSGVSCSITFRKLVEILKERL